MTNIIGLSGHKRSGKNAAYILAKLLLDPDETGRVVRLGFADPLKKMARDEFGWDGRKDENGRKLLQDLGVAMRSVNEDYWVRKMAARLNELIGSRMFPAKKEPPLAILVTDCRFDNEIEMIKRLGGVVWRLERPGLPKTDTHVSETALDDYQFDHLIVADNLDELFAGVKAGLTKLNLYGGPYSKED